MTGLDQSTDGIPVHELGRGEQARKTFKVLTTEQKPLVYRKTPIML